MINIKCSHPMAYTRTKTIFKWKVIFEQYWTEMWDFNDEAINKRPRKQKKALKQVQKIVEENNKEMEIIWEAFTDNEKMIMKSYGTI